MCGRSHVGERRRRVDAPFPIAANVPIPPNGAPPASTPRTLARHAPLDAALKRLSAALDQLEAASARLRVADAAKRDLADALAAMQDDRGQLAEDLDAALTRARTLEQATDEVARRLGRAGVALRRLVTAQGSGA